MDVHNVQMLQLQESIFPEQFHDKRHFVFLDFMAEYKEGDIVLNEELQEYKWVTPKEAMTMNLNESTKSFVEAFMRTVSKRVLLNFFASFNFFNSFIERFNLFFAQFFILTVRPTNLA